MESKKVLIADDDPDILDAVTMILESQGFVVAKAHDGIECLEKLDAEKPDLIILDLLMPKMDGFAVFRELKGPKRQGHQAVPVIILTSVREEASRRRYELENGQELSPDEYLEKPISPRALLDSVEKLLERRHCA